MALVLEVNNKKPLVGNNSFLAPNCSLIGDVVIGNHCSVWFNAVVRGDVNYIRVGDYSNIQDNVVIHGTYLKNGTDIGSYVNIGHQATVHGCILEDHVLVGMGAIVMDRAHVESYVIIAAGSVVLEGTKCESGFLYAGVPAKKVKPITSEQRKLLDDLPLNYVKYAGWFNPDPQE